jgi:hypothetical protein
MGVVCLTHQSASRHEVARVGAGLKYTRHIKVLGSVAGSVAGSIDKGGDKGLFVIIFGSVKRLGC